MNLHDQIDALANMPEAFNCVKIENESLHKELDEKEKKLKRVQDLAEQRHGRGHPDWDLEEILGW